MHLRTAYWLLLLTVGYASSKKHYDSPEDLDSSADYESENNEYLKYQESKVQDSSGNHKFTEKPSYDGAQVWRSRLRNSDDVQVINNLLEEQGSNANSWSFGPDLKTEFDIYFIAISPWMLKLSYADYLVDASQKESVARRLRAYALNHTVLMKNIGALETMHQRPSPVWTSQALRLGHRYNYNYYPPLDVVEEYLSYLGNAYKSICTIRTIGYSVENRAIKMVTVSNRNPHNKGILLSDGLHAREWVAVSSVLYVLSELLTKFDTQPDFVKDKTWYIIPVSNPDGYDFTHNGDRLWRKNRRIFKKCVGVDLNRNFGHAWNVPGVTHQNPCSNLYAGESPFSEPETVAMRRVLTDATMNLVAVCNVHSYGQLVLYPWAAYSVSTPHGNEHRRIAEEMTMAIFNAGRKRYNYGFAYHKADPASGTYMDYVYSSGFHLSFTIEARDTGQSGFLLSEDQIVPTGKEIQAAVYALSKATGQP